MQGKFAKLNLYTIKSSVFSARQSSTVAGQNVFFGGGALCRAKHRGVPGENPLKIFEIFVPEIAANASNLKTS